uniref:Putative myosin class ii heavy chain n=1 Tax=Ixodes ricinus TaxID=34613 RepID=A0A131XZI0_IXORI
MSWAEGEWKVGLPAGALLKIDSLEQQLDRMQKERQQRQMQLDTLQQTLDKQRRKQEEEKASTVQLERERQNLLSQLEEYERRQAKLQQELATRGSQLGSMEVKAAQAGTQSDLPVAPSTPASRRFQSFSSSLDDAPAVPLVQQLQSRVRELEAQLRVSESRPSIPLGTPQRGQAADRESYAMDRLRVENAQLSGKVSELEQKGRQLSQQLECQLHNSEATRGALEQRSRQREAELKEELRMQAQESGRLLKELGESQSRLQQELAGSQKELGLVKAQLERSQAHILSQDRSVGELRQQVSSLEQQERQRSDQVAEAHRSLKQQEQAHRALEARCETLAAQGREAASALEASTRDLRAREAELRKCSTELEQRERDLAQLQGQLASSQSQACSLEQQKQNMERELARSRSDLQREAAHSKDVSTQLDGLQKKLEEQRRAADCQNAALEQLRSELAKAQRESSDALSKIQALEEAAQQSSESARQFLEKAVQLECKLAEAHSNGEASRARSEALAKSLEEKEADWASLLDSKKELERRLTDVTKHAECLASDLARERREATEAAEVVAESREAVARLAKLREELDVATHLQTKAEEALERLEREKVEATSLRELREQEYEVLRGTLEAAAAKLASSEERVRSLEGSVSEGRTEREALVGTLLERESALWELQERADALEAELAEARRALAETDARLRAGEAEAQDQEVRLSKAEAELREVAEKALNLEQTCNDLRCLLGERDSEIAALREALSLKEAAVAALEARVAGVSEMETELRRLREQKQDLEAQLLRLVSDNSLAIKELNEQLVEQVVEHDRVVGELEEAAASLRNLQRDKQDLLAAQHVVEGELAALRRVAADAEVARDALAADAEEKRTAVDTLEAEAEELKQKMRELLHRTNELSAMEVRVAELEGDLAARDAKLEARTAEAEELRRAVAALLPRDKEAEELCHSLCQRNGELDAALLDNADLRARLQEQEREAEEQLQEALVRCLACEEQNAGLREALALEEARLVAGEEALAAARSDCEAEAVERRELEHTLVKQNGELDEKLLELAATQEQLSSASARLSEHEEQLRTAERCVSQKTSQLDELRERCEATAEELSTARHELQEARTVEADLGRQLEERDLSLAELREEVARLCHVEALSAELLLKLAAVERECADLEHLRHELVERNAERDELYVSLLGCREELLDKEHRLQVAAAEIAARDAVLQAQVERLSQPSAGASDEEKPSREGGDTAPGIAAALLDAHCATLSCLEHRSEALRSLQARLERESFAEEPLGEAAEDLSRRVAELAAERGALEQRLRDVKRLASVALDKMRVDVEALSGVVRDAWDSSVSSKSDTVPEMRDETMGEQGVDGGLDPLGSSCHQAASVGDSDTTNLSTCELTLSSSERSGSTEDRLEHRLAHVCRLLGTLRHSVHALLERVHPPALADPGLLACYAGEIEREHAALHRYLVLLQQRVFRRRRQCNTVDVRSELRLEGGDLIEAAASIRVACGHVESVEDEESFFSFDDEAPSCATPEAIHRRELEEMVEQQKAEKQRVGCGLLEIWHGLDGLLRHVETVREDEAREEESEEGRARAKCRELCRRLRDWFSSFDRFVVLVGKVQSQLAGALGGGPCALPDTSALSLLDVGLLETVLNSAFLEEERLARECAALRESLAQREAAERHALEDSASLRSECAMREEEVRLLRSQVAALHQDATKLDEWLVEKEALLKKIHSRDETVDLLNRALEEVEETLQTTCNEKAECQRKLCAFEEEVLQLGSALEQARTQLSERVALLEGELAAKETLVEEARSFARVLEEERGKLASSLEQHEENLAEAKANEGLLRERVASLTETVSALQADLGVELSSQDALQGRLLAGQEELAHCLRELEVLREEKREFDRRRDEGSSELAKLQNVFAQIQEEHGSQIQQLSEEKNGLFVEVTELREKCSQLMAEKERLEEEKRAVLKQAEEQEQELLSTDALHKENGVLRAEVDKLAVKAEEAKELQARIDILEEERGLLEARAEQLGSLENCVEQLQVRLGTAERQRTSLEEQLRQLSASVQELTALRQRVSFLEEELLDVKSQLEEAQRRAGELPELEHKLGSLETANAELSAQVETLEDRNGSQACELEHLTHQLECLQASAEESSGALQALRDRLANQEAEAAALVAQADRRATELREYEDQLRKAEDQIRELSSCRSTLESRLAGEEAQRMALLSQVEERTSECEEYRAQAWAMKGEISELTSLQSSLQGKLAHEEAKTGELNATLAELELACQEHQSRLRAAEDLSDALSSSKSVVEGKLSEAKSEILELEERCRRLEGDNLHLKSAVEERSAEMEKLRGDLDCARQELQDNGRLHVAEVEKLTALRSSLERELAQAVGDAEALGRRCESLESSGEALAREVDMRSVRVQQLECSLAALEQRQRVEREGHEAEAARLSLLRLELDERLRLKEADLADAQARLRELEATVLELRAKLSASESQCDELERKSSAAVATARREEHNRRNLNEEAEQLRTKLTRVEAELGQLRDSSKTQEEAALERLRQELSSSKESELKAWSRVTALVKELQHSKESVAWLRSRMRVYKQRISDLGKVEPPSSEDKEGVASPARDARKAALPSPAAASPVVTRLSLRSQSPSKARLCLTVSAVRQSPASSVAGATKVPWQRQVPPGQPTSTTKRSLFADVPASVRAKTAVEVNPPGRKEPEDASRVSRVLAGVATRNRRQPAAQGPMSGKQHGRPTGESSPVASRDKENEVRPKRKSPEAGLRPRTRRLRQQLEAPGTPLGRDSANLPASGDTTRTPGKRAAGTSPVAPPRAPTRVLPSRGGVTTRARRAAASESNGKDPEDCKVQ